MQSGNHLLKSVFVAVVIAAAACFLSVSASAQTSFGRISGTVSAPDGSVVPGAQVIVKNTETQLTRQTTTDQQGFYVFTELPIGTYSVEVNQTGFSKSTRSGLVLVADGRLTADFTLVVGSTSQTVEVQGTNTETLNTTSGELSRVIDTKQVANLPLNGRNYIQLMTLVPGAVVTNPDQFSVTTSLAANNQTINGNRGDSNNLTVDGAYNMVAGSNTSLMNNVSAEFINEVKLQTSNFSAEYGRMSGPAFNIVTKNGTNDFHGSLFEYFRNDVLDATNYFAPSKTALRFNDFGYSLGGPIIHNKLFFFVGEEWKRLRQNQTTQRQTIPDSAFLSGDFSALLPKTQLYYPGTKTPIPNNNVSNLITPDGKAIANVYALMAKTGAKFVDAPVANNLTR
ncbi:MAG TPA: carboxypeptidase regulatory-like domain-containing protein [Pseudacidobacterium sp.]|nr:carboxypeptidase regulatory-like domain-containing protein [Pseudacidobacterium sp.]